MTLETHCLICGDPVPVERTRNRSTTCSEEHAKIRKANIRKGDHSAKCVVCTEPVPIERQRFRSITCSDDHGALRKKSLRSKGELRHCRACRRPASPIERGAFQRFRRLELMRPDILYPAPFKKWQGETGGDALGFAAHLRTQFELGATTETADASRSDYLGLLSGQSKDAPGGARSGRKRIQWEGGDKDCQHKIPESREGRKPVPIDKKNTCRKCGATRVKP